MLAAKNNILRDLPSQKITCFCLELFFVYNYLSLNLNLTIHYNEIFDNYYTSERYLPTF